MLHLMGRLAEWIARRVSWKTRRGLEYGRKGFVLKMDNSGWIEKERSWEMI